MLELVEHDVVAMSGAVLLAVAFDLLLVLILFGVIRCKSRYLQFPAILRPCPPGDGQHSLANRVEIDPIFNLIFRLRLLESVSCLQP